MCPRFWLCMRLGTYPAGPVGHSLSLTTNIMQQHDKNKDKSKHNLTNIQRENTHTLGFWYGSCVGNRKKKNLLSYVIFFFYFFSNTKFFYRLKKSKNILTFFTY